jgi:esterase FrsA
VGASGTRTVEQVKASLRARLADKKAPFYSVDPLLAAESIEKLTSLDGEHWGAVWSEAGQRADERARQLADKGDKAGAMQAFLHAYGLYHAGRYPVPNHPRKDECFARSRASYLAAGAYFDPPVEAVSLPFAGKPGEGTQVVIYVRRRPDVQQPVIIRWSGIDTWKEERHDINEVFIKRGFASITIDMPGTGEAPVLGSPDGERMYVPVLDWIDKQPNLDSKRVVLIGMSFGGYWATKLAHKYADRLAAVVSWGGPTHFNFQRDWVLKSQHADSYLMDITVARARSVGVTTYDEYVERVSQFSLLDQKLLDNPHPPMLLVNGKDDKQVPIEDIYLLLQRGGPKSVRLFPGGHMGYTPQTLPTIMKWIEGIVATDKRV